jgi:hypothetical protein
MIKDTKSSWAWWSSTQENEAGKSKKYPPKKKLQEASEEHKVQ